MVKPVVTGIFFLIASNNLDVYYFYAYNFIIAACGHIFCVDCLLSAMSIAGVSSCALCKMTYSHFPFECKLIGELVKVGKYLFFLVARYPESNICLSLIG